MTKVYNHLKVLPVLMLLLLLTGCFGIQSDDRPPIPNVPRTYNAEYNRVWNSALDTLDELGYVIAQMDKADGYITTEKNGDGQYREKVSLRIVRDGNKVTVKVSMYEEKRGLLYVDKATKIKTYGSWSKDKSRGYGEKMIKDRIAEKLGLTQ